jgi:hypothetical protein
MYRCLPADARDLRGTGTTAHQGLLGYCKKETITSCRKSTQLNESMYIRSVSRTAGCLWLQSQEDGSWEIVVAFAAASLTLSDKELWDAQLVTSDFCTRVETVWMKIKENSCTPMKVSLAVSGGACQSNAASASVSIDDPDVSMELGAPLLIFLDAAMNLYDPNHLNVCAIRHTCTSMRLPIFALFVSAASNFAAIVPQTATTDFPF